MDLKRHVHETAGFFGWFRVVINHTLCTKPKQRSVTKTRNARHVLQPIFTVP